MRLYNLKKKCLERTMATSESVYKHPTELIKMWYKRYKLSVNLQVKFVNTELLFLNWLNNVDSQRTLVTLSLPQPSQKLGNSLSVRQLLWSTTQPLIVYKDWTKGMFGDLCKLIGKVLFVFLSKIWIQLQNKLPFRCIL